jgi:hypothetical protein
MNLQNWINKARIHWQENRPKLYQSLKKQGTLEPMLKQAAEQTYLEVSQLEDAGHQPDEAFQMVREEYLFPPGEPENEQPAGTGPGLLNEAMALQQRVMEISNDEDVGGIVNKYQKAILIAYSAIVIAMVAYPPFNLVFQGRTIMSEYSWLWEPIMYGKELLGTVDTARLYVQLVAASLVAAALTLAFRSRGL